MIKQNLLKKLNKTIFDVLDQHKFMYQDNTYAKFNHAKYYKNYDLYTNIEQQKTNNELEFTIFENSLSIDEFTYINRFDWTIIDDLFEKSIKSLENHDLEINKDTMDRFFNAVLPRYDIYHKFFNDKSNIDEIIKIMDNNDKYIAEWNNLMEIIKNKYCKLKIKYKIELLKHVKNSV